MVVGPVLSTHTLAVAERTPAVAGNTTIKRKREIKSCLECRSRKIKCDKSRPRCGTCIKFERECVFSSAKSNDNGDGKSNNSNNAYDGDSYLEAGEELSVKRRSLSSTISNCQRVKSLEIKVARLEEQLKCSRANEQKRAGLALCPEDALNIFDTSVDMDRSTAGIPLSFIAIVKADKYLNSMVECIDKGSKVFPIVFQKLFGSVNKLEQLQSKTGETWIAKLLPYFEDKKLVCLLLQKFFKSELVQMASFLSESEIYLKLERILDGTIQGDFKSRLEEETLVIFLGTLLTLMRISSLTVNILSIEIDADLEYIRAHPIEQQAMNLVMSCFIEVKDSILCSIELLQFALLIHHYRSFCPEYSGLSKTFDKVSLSYLHRLATILGLNLEPKTNTEEDDLKRRIWHHIMSIDYTQFASSGSSLTITPNIYTTKLPRWDNGPITTIDNAILASLHEKDRLKKVLDTLPQLLSNVRELPSLEYIEQKNETLLEDLTIEKLNQILKMDNSTVPSKIIKTTKLFNFLDIFSCCFALTYQIFLHYDKKNMNSKAVVYLVKLIKVSNPMITFLDYLNASEHCYSNIQQHFGYNFLFVFKILEIIQKLNLLSFTILGRSIYYQKQLNTTRTNQILEEIKAVSIRTHLLMKSYVMKASSYFFARRMNVIQTLITSKCTGIDFEMSTDSTYFQRLNNSYKDFNDSFIPFVEFENVFEPLRAALLEIGDTKLDLSQSPDDLLTSKDQSPSVSIPTPTTITAHNSNLDLLDSLGDFEFGETDFNQIQSPQNNPIDDKKFATSFDRYEQLLQSHSFLY